MNIASIGTNYAFLRNAQSFGSIYTDSYVKQACGLTDSDIAKINSKCPRGLDVYVYDFGTDGHHIEVARANVRYNGVVHMPRDFDMYYNCADTYNARKRGKSNFINCMNEIIENSKNW